MSSKFLSALLLLRRLAHRGKKNHVANGLLVGHQHSDAVNTDAETAGWRHTNFQGLQKIFIQHLRLLVALSALAGLILETMTLVKRIVQLGESIATFQTTNKGLETFRQFRLAAVCLRQRRDVQRVIRQE